MYFILIVHMKLTLLHNPNFVYRLVCTLIVKAISHIPNRPPFSSLPPPLSLLVLYYFR